MLCKSMLQRNNKLPIYYVIVFFFDTMIMDYKHTVDKDTRNDSFTLNIIGEFKINKQT